MGKKRERLAWNRRDFLKALAAAGTGSAVSATRRRAEPLAGMTRRAVLDEPRMSCSWAFHVERLVQWLGDNGFVRLNGDKIGVWMQGRIDEGNAYGSVAVLDRGTCPVSLMAGPYGGIPRWLRYLHAGGRIVWIGDVPFLYVESPTVRPPPFGEKLGYFGFDYSRRGLGLLGLPMEGPYWSNHGLRVVPNPAASAWGFELVGFSETGFPADDVTLAFDLYSVAATARQGTADWFKNVQPGMPWSGLVKIEQHFHGDDDVYLRDAWRAANYIGKPLAIPPLPPPARAAASPALQINLAGGGMAGRHEYVRGEKVQVSVAARASLGAASIRVELRQEGVVLWHREKPCTTTTAGAAPLAVFTVDTAPYAYGAYEIQARALGPKGTLAGVSETFGVRHVQPEAFNWEIWYGVRGTNPLRTDLELKDISQAGMEIYLTGREDFLTGCNPGDYLAGYLAGADAATKYGLGFSVRAMPDLSYGRHLTFEKAPGFYRFGANGKPVLTNPYSLGRPSLGISNPAVRTSAMVPFAETIKHVAGHPGFRPYVLTDDDYVVYQGFDYAPHVLDDFRTKTGLEPPRAMELPKNFGPVAEDNPWLRWNIYTLEDVCAPFNKAQTDAAVRVRPDLRVGPIPGVQQFPMVVTGEVEGFQASEYPTYDFGKNGFNLVCSYYYNEYWQPVMAATFWMEIGHMDNRDLPEWNMPDCYMTGGYTRNNFYHYLAGGVKGLAYFTYGLRNSSTWAELRRLGQTVRRVGLIQRRLVPARRDIGILNSLTANCFDPLHTVIQAYGYFNLMQGHFDVEMVSENEIVDGRASRYKAVLLYNVRYLRRAAYDALAAHAAGGGTVLLDTSIPFDIPGAKRLAVDIGMGNGRTVASGPLSTGIIHAAPGPSDYGQSSRIEPVKRALSEYVAPWFQSNDIRLVATRFEAGGVPYIWFVNALSGEEYRFCRKRMGAGAPGAMTHARQMELLRWETTQTAQGPYVSEIILDGITGVPYDLLEGRKVPVTKAAQGGHLLTLSMERFGGTLLAFFPEEITGVELGAPARLKREQPCRVRATVLGKSKPVPGAVSVAFTLRDPDGNASVASGVRATEDGSAAWEWVPAVNDTAGKWTIEAEELASGRTASATMALS